MFVLFGFWFLLGQRREIWFWSGFFIGLLWFYWISFSFVYYDLAYMIPLVLLGIALVYGYLFWLIAFLGKNIFFQALFLLGVSFISPFGFNWLILELPLLHSFFAPTTLSLALILGSLVLLKVTPKWYKLSALILLAFAINTPHKKPPSPVLLDVALPVMHIPQSQRWDKAYQQKAISLNFSYIEKAIEEGKKLIVLPESAFPLYLNQEPFILDALRSYSYHIGIIAGALTYEESKVFNSSYFFNEGEMEIAHKIILVPFGEEVPLPEVLVKVINKLFFNGAQDYEKAKNPHDFILKNISIRSAICFEATADKLYEKSPTHMVAISNNAWFHPSIESTLQYLLLEYYAKKYHTVIYHSANAGKSGVIVP